MLTPKRVILAVGLFLFFLVTLSFSSTRLVKTSIYSALKDPISFSQELAQLAVDFVRFRENAEENRDLKERLAEASASRLEAQEFKLENGRLARLLDLKPSFVLGSHRVIYARVMARSPVAWNRVFLIDKGVHGGIQMHMPVLAQSALIGKVIEAGPSVSKVLLITDSNSRIGVLIQRTRQEGILFGTPSGECRMKYISVDVVVRPGDLVETAGFGGYFPKALPVGTVRNIWKEPGQIYQVAEIKPLADLSRIEEVTLLDPTTSFRGASGASARSTRAFNEIEKEVVG